MESFINIISPVDTKNFVFILPSVSVGNVGQLTVDLLILSNKFKKFATLWDPSIIPLVGGDPFTGNSSNPCTACELFVNEDLKVVVMQLRSSLEYKLASSFFEKLKQCILTLKISEVVVLTSSFAYEMHNVSSGHFYYITNNSEQEGILKKLHILPMEPSVDGRFKIHGAGFASGLYEVLKVDLKCTILIKYSSEGDNRPDALLMLDILYRTVSNFNGINSENVLFPKSWDYVFGNPAPVGIY